MNEEHKLAAMSRVRLRLQALGPRRDGPVLRADKFGGAWGTIVDERELEPRDPSDRVGTTPVPATVVLECALRTDFRYGAGSLFGLAIGDALGTTLEFTSIDGLSFRERVRGPHREIIGQGPFGLQPGQVTDDTQMAICLFDSIVEREHVDPDDLLTRYRAWKQVAFDIGNQTRAALGATGPDGGRTVWDASGRRAAGNGALMRTAPIGVLFGLDPASRRDGTFVDGGLTHFDPRSQLACAAFNAAVGAAIEIRDTRTSATELVDAARVELPAAARQLADRYPDLAELVDEARVAILEDLELANAADPQLYGPVLDLRKQQGFVRVAFRLAFWELVHAPSFEAGIVDVVNRGGDSDTNGAIAGALLGAFHGIDEIPDRWLQTVLSAPEGESGSITSYHPQRFFDGLQTVHARAIALAATR